MKRWQFISVLLIALASALWSSGIIPAIIPAAVPTANKIGNSSKFQLGASGAVAGDCPTFDANLNITGPGTGTACGTAANAGGGLTVYSGLAGVALTGTLYFPIGGGSQASSTETNVDADISASTTISRFGANLSTALGVANSVVFTWRKNTTDQTLTCTISGAVATSCADTVNSFAVSPGDLVDIKAVFSGTIAAAPVFILTAQAGSLVQGQVNTATAGNIGYYATSSATISGGNFTGDVSNSTLALTVNKVNGVAYASGPSTNTTPVITASNTATYTALPSCADTGGNHLNFDTVAHTFSCGTSGGGGSSVSYFFRQAAATSGTTLAMPLNIVVGNYLFVTLGSGTPTPTISDSLSNSWTTIDATTNQGGDLFGRFAFSHITTGGADTLTLSGGGAAPNIAAMELVTPASGFAGTLDVHGFAKNGIAAVSLTASQGNELAVSAVQFDHSNTYALALLPISPAAVSTASDSSSIGYGINPVPAQTMWLGFQAINGANPFPTDAIVFSALFK
jgi:hypothetical protein